MNTIQLSTTTLARAVKFEQDWSTQRSILETLKHRKDLFNLEPVLELAVDQEQHPAVRRSAVECAATHNGQFTLRWLRELVENTRAAAGARRLALHGLSVLQLPHLTLPVIEQTARNSGPYDLRIEALGLVAKYRNVRSAGLLTELARGHNTAIAEAAKAALDDLIEANGGRRAVVAKMIDRAGVLKQRGQRAEAEDVLRVAARLEPYNGKLLYEMARIARA